MNKKLNKIHFPDGERLFKRPAPLGPIEASIETIEMPTYCPNTACGSTNIRQKGKVLQRREILHAEGGKLKKITLLRPRCECLDCKKTFYPKLVAFENNGPFSVEAVDTIVKTVLEHPETSSHSIASTIQKDAKLSSSSAVDRTIKNRIKDLSTAVRFIPCSKLFYLPFKYKSRKNCCAILGLKSSEKKIFLLDIYQDSSVEELKYFFDKISVYKTKPKLFLASFNRSLLNTIKEIFNGAVGVLGGYLNKRIDEYYDNDLRYNAIAALKTIVRRNDTMERGYYDELAAWEKEFLCADPDTNAQLKPLYNEILTCKKECWIGTRHKPWESEFTMLQDVIRKCEYNNSSFEFMRFRLLYANRAATGTLDGDKILRYVQNICEPVEGPIRAFGVDIRELYKEMEDEEERIRHALEN